MDSDFVSDEAKERVALRLEGGERATPGTTLLAWERRYRQRRVLSWGGA